jgi:hypothetical protein
VASKYPFPKYRLIIEPFAGSARYSLLHGYNRNVVLCDSYLVIANIWKYLIQATPDQINNLPNLKRGDDLREFEMLPVERDLMGFMVNRGSPYPKNIYTTWSAASNEIEKSKQKIIKDLDNIRHYKIIHGDYRELKNVEATWFIDPPYQNGGQYYVHNKINYSELADWCKSRKGQVIVCENSSASWLKFKPLCETWGQKKTSKELVWTKGCDEKTRFVNKNSLYTQLKLF